MNIVDPPSASMTSKRQEDPREADPLEKSGLKVRYEIRVAGPEQTELRQRQIGALARLIREAAIRRRKKGASRPPAAPDPGHTEEGRQKSPAKRQVS
jgi:hypothetical protein